MKFYTDIDLRQNELQFAVIHALSNAPTGKMGQLYYNTNEKAMYQHNGTQWVRVGVAYDMALGDQTGNTVPITLVGSDGSLDSVPITGSDGVTITKSGNGITISATDTNTTYTFSGTASATKYTFTITPSAGSAQTIDIPLANATNAGLMSPAQYTKLAGIEDGAEVNTNNFSSVAVNGTPIGATSDDDTFSLVAGQNVTLTPDTANKRVTISSSSATTYPTGTDEQLDSGESTTPSLWTPKTLHDYVEDTSIANRGYSCDETETELFTETVTTEDAGSDAFAEASYSSFINADRLLVDMDGMVYSVNRISAGSDNWYGGYDAESSAPDYSEYPFAINSVDIDGNTYNKIRTQTAGTYTFSVTAYTSNVDTTSCFEEAVRSVSGGGGTKNVWYGTCSSQPGDDPLVITTTTGDFGGNDGDVLIVRYEEGYNGNSNTLTVDGNDYIYSTSVLTPFEAAYAIGGEMIATYVCYDNYGRQVLAPIDDYTLSWASFLHEYKQSKIDTTKRTLLATNWSNNTITITASAVTSSNSVVVTPAPENMADYISAGIYCSGQGTSSLTFTCTTVPTSNINVNVMAIN